VAIFGRDCGQEFHEYFQASIAARETLAALRVLDSSSKVSSF
jgi:hypothetical protein